MSGIAASRDMSSSSTELARHLALFISAPLPLGFPPAIVVSWCYSTALLPLFPQASQAAAITPLPVAFQYTSPTPLSLNNSNNVFAV
ncbi:hypothetical protein DdX_04932 [Ditylenchus destructor]|uniref:Uncharacterized protein n=1 Tax=Ditylenchus destructor TaxID=166010 RepID=A0AAD4N8R8_9BILA|nr:hypothetical protein DdX_04932 [Ditylenchus destructor]